MELEKSMSVISTVYVNTNVNVNGQNGLRSFAISHTDYGQFGQILSFLSLVIYHLRCY